MRSFGSFQLVWVIGVLVFGTCASTAIDEVWALTAFREAIYDDPHLVFSNWNSLDTDPCNWRGIYCSPIDNHIITLNLSGSSLKGFLSQELGSLSYLQELILHKNNLLGTIPKEIGMLKNLKVLDLGMNQLSGPIPPEIGNLISTTKINLQSNGLTGSVPPEFGNLRNLVELRLDRNKLEGTVPATNSNFSYNKRGMSAPRGIATGFCRSPQLRIADFSFNFFIGKVPECLRHLPRSSFQGNCFQDENPKQQSSQRCDINVAPPAVTEFWEDEGVFEKLEKVPCENNNVGGRIILPPKLNDLPSPGSHTIWARLALANAGLWSASVTTQYWADDFRREIWRTLATRRPRRFGFQPTLSRFFQGSSGSESGDL